MNSKLEQRLIDLGKRLVDQNQCRIMIPPKKNAPGFWFGGGKLTRFSDGTLYVSGRYRNSGDSRNGLEFGERGAELALFASANNGTSWEKVLSFNKDELGYGNITPISIEGTALRETDEGVELLVSTEKRGIEYPEGLESFRKPGSGVWTIDILSAPSVDKLKYAVPKPYIFSSDSRFIHVKDPFFFTDASGRDYVLFCTHPFCWSSSNTGYLNRSTGQLVWDFFPRGHTWDVAISRGTTMVSLPGTGILEDLGQVTLLFYDGGECLRNHDEHASAVKRPRGYSCEELGGLAYMVGDDFSTLTRLSVDVPLFVSPYGTGCSRYVDVLAEDEGIFAVWQQSQPDLSQPFVMNYLPMEEVMTILKK